MKCSDAIVKLLEDAGIKYVFGHPGEHVLPLYESLRTSSIKHVLLRHEQGAAHAADGYARASGEVGVCITTGGPGALNLVMGVATAYKDSIPLIVITGDIPRGQRGLNVFQEVELEEVFKPITRYTFKPDNGEEAVLTLKKAILYSMEAMGPIHVDISKDIFQEDVNEDILLEEVDYSPVRDYSQIGDAIGLLESSKRPLIVAGAGVLWGLGEDAFREFVELHRVPVATTYPARGVLGEDHPLCLGMIGSRGTPAANYAGRNCDLILALGCKISERTIVGFGDSPIIHVNIDKDALKGDVNLQMDVKGFLGRIKSIGSSVGWIRELEEYSMENPPAYDDPPRLEDYPLKPSQVISRIFALAPDAIIVNDAGSHTTWVTLYRRVLESRSLIYSGAFGPMGYGLPASIGVKLARPDRKIILIVGDGGFQMTMQELGTIMERELPIVICVLNNSSLGIIRQWQEMEYGESYQVRLENPDFVKLARSYNMGAVRIEKPEELEEIMPGILGMGEPFLVEIKVVDEDIPLPNV
ncbi:MAG TPA: thiamine pyrophosphate-binding protein [Methanothermobacter sp.]|nr:thiamine pyrophosphate [Methanothermobacter sp. MT-2]HHW04951.1 thiamine pyrophosphate-binding protein [Methanothermobacter sp.]HOK73272.1 thiamine pyrophosphate-binding protein [Methanothermobacter sp.]HOL69507.1 thiamine pyrophosphate-binding protein [Methanothermobacter sp.]HPQ05034.1 thiamine pyrophosphate-binding protein [Methanothermobacter sp.]